MASMPSTSSTASAPVSSSRSTISVNCRWGHSPGAQLRCPAQALRSGGLVRCSVTTECTTNHLPSPTSRPFLGHKAHLQAEAGGVHVGGAHEGEHGPQRVAVGRKQPIGRLGIACGWMGVEVDGGGEGRVGSA